MSRFNPSNYTVTEAKPLPVILLLDTSSSMGVELPTENGQRKTRIDALNEAVESMINTFVQQAKVETAINLAIVKFGATVEFHLTYDPNTGSVYKNVLDLQWHPVKESGSTPLNTALRMTKDFLEDKAITPSKGYKPTVILISDGQPNNGWEEPLNAFVNSGRSSKCNRIAMAIGAGGHEEVLRKFIVNQDENPEYQKLYVAEDATEIHKFFQFVTMSVTATTEKNVTDNVEDNTQKVTPSLALDEDDVF
ncbi:vWA domain-containing protein [Acinetobacter terrae]|jgi:uncharacterized protein YegL|uniref:VWA domain-containing protein n=1 Tax=Acinetobacter terrae TaxID=2731247 RepID=A0A8E4F837_9GAMM|nr:VWA domain-containing protein [Acinetobacter terrae]NNH37993.1 VWA domain-containing protein [Acinetobacter terrae]